MAPPRCPWKKFRSVGRGNAVRLPTFGVRVRLPRGLRMISIVAENAAVSSLTILQKPSTPAPEQLALHYRLLGMEPGADLIQPRKAAEQILRTFVRKAYRRPVESADLAPLLKLYDRAAERGDPFEERMKLALKGVLVSPDFLFKIEHRSDKPGIYPLGQYELAARLSYFLWSTMPDDELNQLAAQGRLQDPAVLTAQVDRMLDDPKSRNFSSTFIGQWLGTQDLGGRAAPMLTELQAYYTPPVAADLRAEPILIFERILGENRSLLELLTGDYTYMTERLVKFYQLEDKFPDFHGNDPQLVEWPDNRRAGIMNLGSVMAMTSHYRQTSPVLRGAWVLDTLLGTPVPPPPPNIPPLLAVACKDDCVVTAKTAVGMRNTILAHRANATCAACHNLMDPMGFALENFDWTGRWRDKEFDGSSIDTTGSLPSGEKFDGPAGLRQVLLDRKDDFLRQITAKILGYALGRSLQDGDSCTVQHLADSLQKDNYQARTLIRQIVLSTPFRNSQGGVVTIEAAAPTPPKRVVPMVVKVAPMAPQLKRIASPAGSDQIESGLIATVVALSMLVVLVSGFAMSVGFLYLNPDIFKKVVTEHFRGIMGPPVCAMTATAVVAILRATSATSSSRRSDYEIQRSLRAHCALGPHFPGPDGRRSRSLVNPSGRK